MQTVKPLLSAATLTHSDPCDCCILAHCYEAAACANCKCSSPCCLFMPCYAVAAMQIPKLIALASVAVRVQWREADEHLEECTANLMAVGGVLHLDILSLPVPASKANGWTLRAVIPDTQVIHRHVRSKPTRRCRCLCCAFSLQDQPAVVHEAQVLCG